MWAGWIIKDTADVPKPGPGQTRGLKKRQKGVSSVLRLIDFRNEGNSQNSCVNLGTVSEIR